MKPEQNEIYYISGSHIDIIEKNPNLEYFKKNNIEVLYLTDTVDIFTIPYIREYKGKQLKSIEKADIKIESSSENQSDISEEQKNKLIERFKEVLKDKVENVVPSARLVSSPVTLVVGEQGLDPQLEKIMQVMDKDFTVSKRILEINLSHPIMRNLVQNMEHNNTELVDNAINQLYEGALLIEGYMKNPAEFVQRMNLFIEKATENLK
jgi:molecular chaperone HtpG